MMRRIVGIIVALIIVIPMYVIHAQSADTIKAQIDALLQQIALLQQQLGGGTIPIPNTPPVGNTPCPLLTRSLGIGVSGDDVAGLQRFLASDPTIYPEGQISGYFGTLTQRAVQKFQTKFGLVSGGSPESTGWGRVGPGTRAMIAKVCLVSAKRSCTVGSGGDAVPFAHGETKSLFRAKSVGYGEQCMSVPRTCNDGLMSGDASFQYAVCSAAINPLPCRLDGVEIGHGQSRTFFRQNSVLFGQTCAPFGQSRTCTNGVLSGSQTYSFANCSVAAADSCTVVASSATSTVVEHGKQRYFYSADTVPYTQTCDQVKQLRICTDGVLSGFESHVFPLCRQIPAKDCEIDLSRVPHGSTNPFFTTRSHSDCESVSKDRTCTNGVLSGPTTHRFVHCAKPGSEWCVLDGKYVAHNATSTFYSSTEAPFGSTCSQFAKARSCRDGEMQGEASYQFAECTQRAAEACTLDGKTVPHLGSASFYDTTRPPSGESCAIHQLTRTCTDGILSGHAAFSFATCSE